MGYQTTEVVILRNVIFIVKDLVTEEDYPNILSMENDEEDTFSIADVDEATEILKVLPTKDANIHGKRQKKPPKRFEDFGMNERKQ